MGCGKFYDSPYIINTLTHQGMPFYGMHFISDPILMVQDADLVKQILVKDFHHFVDRNFSQLNSLKGSSVRTDQIWMQQMTSAEGDQWKNLRSTFTPIFTSGKMKGMMGFIQETCSRLLEEFGSFADQGQDFELKTALGKYSMDSIASCAFGVDAQAFSNSKSKFVEYAAAIFRQDMADGLKFALLFLPFNMGPKVLSAFGLSFFKATETEFFYQVSNI